MDSIKNMKILYVGRVPSWHKSAYGGEEHMEQMVMGIFDMGGK